VSILSGAHETLLPKISDLLKEEGVDDILFIAGGVIPEDDIPSLKERGVAEIFTPGTPTTVTIDYIKENIRR
jgi:methylmalonyl-CoA mutase C-terminal domain/subunit